MSSYKVYPDDSSGMPRNHHAIFVKTHEGGHKSGFLYHVTGNIQNEMEYNHKNTNDPAESVDFGDLKQLIGIVTKDDYLDVRSIINSVPPPK
jgi:hypothetical protein